MPVSGNELASLDFANLIGGPLNAIVKAQAKSALTTTEFIKSVGFKDGQVRNATFSYTRSNEKGEDQKFTLRVPFLTMVPIPYVAVTEGEVEFNAKINSTTETSSEENLGVDASLSVTTNWFVKVKLDASVSYQKKSSTTDNAQRSFDMRVYVKVRNDDMPAGTERLLDMLEKAIKEKAPKTSSFRAKVANPGATTTLVLTPEQAKMVKKGSSLVAGDKTYMITNVNNSDVALDPAPEANALVKDQEVTIKP